MPNSPTHHRAHLLTRQWRDTPNGIELTFWAKTRDGQALRITAPRQEAVCFTGRETDLSPLSRPLQNSVRRKALPLQTLKGQPADALYCRKQADLTRLREASKAKGILLGESDIKPADRYLMERFITSTFQAEGAENAVTPNQTGTQSTVPATSRSYLSLNPARLKTDKDEDPIDWEPLLTLVSLDIETDGLDGALFSIGVSTPSEERVFLRASEPPETDIPVEALDTEVALLNRFFDWLTDTDPDLIIGWNVVNFDLDYLDQRCRHWKIPLRMGRGNERCAVLQPQTDAQHRIARIPGRVILDGIDLLKAAFWTFDSFALGNVAHQLLGKEKLIEQTGREKIEEIRRQYREDPAALVAYNLEDCRLVREIFDHADLIAFALQRARLTGLPLDRQGGSVAAFDNLYLPQLHRVGYVAPDVGQQLDTTASPGGYVMDSQPGLFDNVLVLDFKSLYPSIIRTFHIDPAGLAKATLMQEADAIPGFLNARFSRQTQILPQLITGLWAERDAAKQAKNASLSQAIKIIMNSFYGVLGSNGCRFFDPRLASSITKRGHEIIQRSRDWIEAQGYKVIYGDTDSVFVLLGEMPRDNPNSAAPAHSTEDQWAKQIGTQLAQGLNQWWTTTLQEELHIPSRLEIEFETHYTRFLMPTVRGSDTGSKKRYAGTIRNQEGTLEMKFKGLEAARTDWTPLARHFQIELYRRVFMNEPWEDYVRDIVTQLRNGELDEQLTYKKRLRRKLADYTKNVPPHVQAARKLAAIKSDGNTDHDAELNSNWIEYRITLNGPEPLQHSRSAPDYDHYQDRQLQPVADSLLYFLGTSLDETLQQQTSLF